MNPRTEELTKTLTRFQQIYLLDSDPMDISTAGDTKHKWVLGHKIEIGWITDASGRRTAVNIPPRTCMEWKYYGNRLEAALRYNLAGDVVADTKG